ncbi:3D domain-containing protein [Variovorax paradoxus]|jgi:3D (Asp-Asp-Asp) domain-containing protein|uniref:3D domain-containing protein n=1 Tax=Variovorax paradoxus TaxID=34073 RepID=UPI0033966ADA
MTEQVAAIGTGTTNQTPGSTVVVSIADLTLAWEIQSNTINNDKLPIIPTASRVQNGQILYRLKIKATLTSIGKNAPEARHTLTVTSDRTGDTIKTSSAATDAAGTVTVTLESREKGKLKLSISEKDITSVPLEITLSDAWYESTFLLTGYNVCNESDFSGTLVTANGLSNQHRDDFLFGARGVVMQGTGMALNGQYVRPTRVGSAWATNSRGNPTRMANPGGVTFAYTTGVHGAFGAVTTGRSIAVDPRVIPPHGKVEIDSIGTRYADDRGSRIQDYHIDNFLGAGNGVVQTWQASGFNSTQRKVKFIGGL